MKIHEYQAKDLFRSYGIPVLQGKVAQSPEEASSVAPAVSSKGPWVVKAQIHAGGRGKGGGIKLAKTLDEVKSHASAILSRPLITPQTSSSGQKVRTLLIEEGCGIASELYCAAVLDRATSSIVLMVSSQGGMEIEEVAHKDPSQIIKVHVAPGLGVSAYHARTLAFGLGLKPELHKSFSSMIASMVKLFVEKDCSLVEINPLAITQDGKLIALDAKINFDDNAMFRHPELAELRDTHEEDPMDLEAAKWNLNFIHLSGNIGCMVNGAGLAMATMDIISFAGGEPANFLDVGGGASSDQVREAFKLLVKDPKVKAILVNIFGGILRCDSLATGIVEAARQIQFNVPLVVRLEGTNVEEGRRILKDSGLNIETAPDMKEAAKLAVNAAKGK